VLAKSALGTATQVVTYASALASNDIVLIQTAAGALQKLTVWGRTPATNATVIMDNVLGTNLAVGDTFGRLLTTQYTQLAPASGTNVVLSAVAGLASNDVVVIRKPTSGAALTKATVFGVATNGYARLTVRGGVREAMTIGDQAYEVGTNYAAFLEGAAADATTWHVGTTNGFESGSVVLVETAAGDRKVMTLDAVATTNITVAAAAGFAIAVNDRIYSTLTNYTVRLPAVAGDREVILDCSTNWGSNTVVAFVPTGRPTWTGIGSGPTVATNIYGLTLTSGVTNAAGAVWQEVTNSYPVMVAASGLGYSLVASNATGLTAGDEVAISPASGGTFLNTYRRSFAEVMNTVSFTSTNTISLAAGDQVFKTAAQTTPVGAATVRLSGEAVWWVPAGRPAQLTVDGTSAVSVNGIVWK
jgi:hypothetical protein